MAAMSEAASANQERICAAIAALKPGEVASYGEIAARAGLPGRARLAARVLSELPDGHALPWYRVMRSDGRIAFPPGSAGYREQVARLRAEGVVVTHGRVKRSAHDPLDSLLWSPPARG